MAEQFGKEWLKSSGLENVKIVSRSISTDYEPVGSPASEQGVQLMRELYGIDMSNHRSQLLSGEDVENASLVFNDMSNYSKHSFIAT